MGSQLSATAVKTLGRPALNSLALQSGQGVWAVGCNYLGAGLFYHAINMDVEFDFDVIC